VVVIVGYVAILIHTTPPSLDCHKSYENISGPLLSKLRMPLLVVFAFVYIYHVFHSFCLWQTGNKLLIKKTLNYYNIIENSGGKGFGYSTNVVLVTLR
jgi:hypothetical protein